MPSLLWAMGVENFVKKSKVRLNLYVQEFVYRIGSALVMATPVDTGHLRAMWSLSKDHPFYKAGQYRVGPEDKTGEHTIAEMKVFAMSVRAGDIVYIVNGARYASYVERGTSQMEPRLFMASTLARSGQIQRSVINRVSRGKGELQ